MTEFARDNKVEFIVDDDAAAEKIKSGTLKQFDAAPSIGYYTDCDIQTPGDLPDHTQEYTGGLELTIGTENVPLFARLFDWDLTDNELELLEAGFIPATVQGLEGRR